MTVLNPKRKSPVTVVVRPDISHAIAPTKPPLEPTEVMVVEELAVEPNVTNVVRRDISHATVTKATIITVEDIKVEVVQVDMVVPPKRVIPVADTDICLGIVPKDRNATTVCFCPDELNPDLPFGCPPSTDNQYRKKKKIKVVNRVI